MSFLINSTFLIGGQNTDAIPVQTIDSEIGYYTDVLGFTVTAMDATTASLERDGVRIGLAVSDEDPEQFSLGFSVSDVEAAYAEIAAKNGTPSALRTDTYDGKRYRVFFAKEPYGVCFCFSQPMTE